MLPEAPYSSVPEVDALAPELPTDPLGEMDSVTYGLYVEAVDLGLAGFYQLVHDVFVVQGWDVKKNQANVCNTHFLMTNTLKTIM